MRRLLIHRREWKAEVPRAGSPSQAGYRDALGDAVLSGGSTCALPDGRTLPRRASWRGAGGGQRVPSLPPRGWE